LSPSDETITDDVIVSPQFVVQPCGRPARPLTGRAAASRRGHPCEDGPMVAVRAPRSGATPSARWRRAIALAIVAVLAGVALHLLGRSRRVIGRGRPIAAAEVLLVHRNGAVLDAWRERGLRGRVVVHVGRFLHFVSEDDPAGLAAAALRRFAAKLAGAGGVAP